MLPLTWKIKQQIGSDPTLGTEYPPGLGLPEFTRRVTELALGKDSQAIVENRVGVTKSRHDFTGLSFSVAQGQPSDSSHHSYKFQKHNHFDTVEESSDHKK